jgi:hypothetical protein
VKRQTKSKNLNLKINKKRKISTKEIIETPARKRLRKKLGSSKLEKLETAILSGKFGY